MGKISCLGASILIYVSVYILLVMCRKTAAYQPMKHICCQCNQSRSWNQALTLSHTIINNGDQHMIMIAHANTEGLSLDKLFSTASMSNNCGWITACASLFCMRWVYTTVVISMYCYLALSKDCAYQPRLPDFINEGDAMVSKSVFPFELHRDD